MPVNLAASHSDQEKRNVWLLCLWGSALAGATLLNNLDGFFQVFTTAFYDIIDLGSVLSQFILLEVVRGTTSLFVHFQKLA